MPYVTLWVECVPIGIMFFLVMQPYEFTNWQHTLCFFYCLILSTPLQEGSKLVAFWDFKMYVYNNMFIIHIEIHFHLLNIFHTIFLHIIDAPKRWKIGLNTSMHESSFRDLGAISPLCNQPTLGTSNKTLNNFIQPCSSHA